MPPKSPKRRRSGTSTTEANPAAYPNHVWSYDFVADQTTDGKTLRFLTRDRWLNRWLFESVREAREPSEAWLHEYNRQRPHGSLGGRSPAKFFELWEAVKREAA